MEHPPEAYKLIRHWHVSTGSFPYYWKNLQQTASNDGAPLNAIFSGAKIILGKAEKTLDFLSAFPYNWFVGCELQNGKENFTGIINANWFGLAN